MPLKIYVNADDEPVISDKSESVSITLTDATILGSYADNVQPRVNAKNGEIRMELKAGDFAGTLLIKENEGAVISGEITNYSGKAQALKNLEAVFLIKLNGASETVFFKNGYQSWSETRVFKSKEVEKTPAFQFMTAMQDDERNPPAMRPEVGSFRASMYAIIGSGSDERLALFCQRKGFNQYLSFNVSKPYGKNSSDEVWLTAIWDFGDKVFSPQEKMNLDELAITLGNDACDMLDDFFQPLTQNRAGGEIPSGWCSWYYYYTKVTRGDIFKNVDAASPKSEYFKYFLVDDGYQTAVGDWLSFNKKFPDGLAPVSDKIRSSGMKAGVWFAPFIAAKKSKLYREHPDWFLRDENGKPVNAGYNPLWALFSGVYALDTTNPDFQDYLRGVVKTFVKEYGFSLLKLDFVYAASLEGKAYDQSLTSAQRLRKGFEIIRETAGEDVFLIGCGSPLSPAIGIVDAMRIGPDVAPYWFATLRYRLLSDPHALCAKFAIRGALNRAQMHKRLWINDPDCLMIRSRNTKLTPEERKTLAAAIIVSGGMFLVSDDLTKLYDEDWKFFEKVSELAAKCRNGNAKPLDLMERPMPELVYNDAGYLAVFNFQDKLARKKIDLKRYPSLRLRHSARFEEAFTGEIIEAREGELDLKIMPKRSSLLLKIL